MTVAGREGACPCCGSEGDGRRRVVGGFSWGRCRGCGTWRLLDDGPGWLGSRWVEHEGWPPAEPMVRSHEATLAELERLAPGRRLLDVGAGRGDLLAAAQARGWDVTGVEPYGRAVEEARTEFALQLVHAEWGDGVVAPGSFDAVVLNHVIEHVPRPREALEAAGEALVGRGILYVAAPSSRTVDALVSSRTRACLFDPPRHRFVFSDRSLAGLVRGAGFSIVSARPQVSRLARPLLRSRVSTQAALDAIAKRDAGDVLRDDRLRPALAAGTDGSGRARALAVVVRAARSVLPGPEVRIYARKP